MQLCFVSVHGPREPYFVDEPRILEVKVGDLTNVLGHGARPAQLTLHCYWQQAMLPVSVSDFQNIEF
jgi:hypothetical protein